MDLNQENVPVPTHETNNRKTPKILWVVVLAAVLGAYWGGFSMGKKGLVIEPKEFKVVNVQDQAKTVDYQLLWDALSVVNEKYIEKAPTPEEYLYGAVKGAVEATGDPYTTFFKPVDFENFQTDLKGSFDGIGAEIGKRGENIVVVAPLDGTPAHKAGILAKDIILKVNGEDTFGWTVEQTVSKIRGKAGTEVTLTLFREGKTEAFDVKLVRAKIEVKSVKSEVKDVNGKKIAVITLTKFGDDSKNLFNKAVNDVLTQGVNGIVLDLRNNPGGYLQTAVDLASHWVNTGDVVVTEEYSRQAPTVYKASGNPRLSGIKTVVLINGGSASASEILAGALKDHGKASLIGEKSFGKGSVQELVELRDGTALKVTVAKWVTPSGKNLNKEGLVPDIEVGYTEQDFIAAKDPQMDKALEEVTK